ncbi:UNVERIFIED_CONTAM: NAP1-related protein 2 [Sesamum calycinum]|uniref:NAP1-related protein 2 n=1 Tax=Sesamum calycinum TaxID=2727403 RepID=A0AAW2MPM0_9LAMI
MVSNRAKKSRTAAAEDDDQFERDDMLLAIEKLQEAQEELEKIFKYLDSLEVEDFKDPRKGYCITFNFKANPYFENTELTKTIKFFDEGTLRSTGTTIRWKEGKVAELIKEDLWPNPIEHLNNEDDEDYTEDDDDGDEGDEDDNDEDGCGNDDE